MSNQSEREKNAKRKALERDKKRRERIYLSLISVVFIAIIAGILALANRGKIDKIYADLGTDPGTTEATSEASVSQKEQENLIEVTVVENTETAPPAEPEPDPRLNVLTRYNNLGIVIAESFLNIRSTPSLTGSIIGKIWRNSGLEILEDDGSGWYRIRSGGIEGYCYSELIATGEEAAELAVENCFLMAKVNAVCLNVREEPSMNGTVWTQLNCDEMQIVERVVDDNWLEVAINSTTGYISSEFTDLGYYLTEGVAWSPLDDTTETRRNLVNYGMQFLGTPYKYGGMSLTQGIDCSGFTQEVYKTANVSLHRESYNQKTQGVYVNSIHEAKPGDLLFYTDQNGQVNHVAIYIGSNQILHACESRGGVTITTYNYSTEPAYIKDVIQD